MILISVKLLLYLLIMLTNIFYLITKQSISRLTRLKKKLYFNQKRMALEKTYNFQKHKIKEPCRQLE